MAKYYLPIALFAVYSLAIATLGFLVGANTR